MRILALILVAAAWTTEIFSIQVVTDSPNVVCRELKLHREVRVYKDPTLFLSNLNLIYTDPAAGWDALMEESPVLTTLKGEVQLMQLGPPRDFRGFDAIAKLYELAEPRLEVRDAKGPSRIIPVKICGHNQPYTDALGFVLEADVKLAQKEELEGRGLPPSTYPNPIPKLQK